MQPPADAKRAVPLLLAIAALAHATPHNAAFFIEQGASSTSYRRHLCLHRFPSAPPLHPPPLA